MEREELREFLHFLDGTDMTEDEKLEYIECVQRVISEFVALGWGTHPIQQASDAKERDECILTQELLDNLKAKHDGGKPEDDSASGESETS
ncbi:hypothetical protein KAJ83_19135 [Marivibrio halodurans]|uniref:Uncharacterized protein n=1 Tax=Marivibrio halodurans TaxID=2039722 RepID=A0A8J7S3F2_9PROT|nr:hypothetical protein [Marivibrio halodurans]MBP5859135.1 hypothetical protein [Marivibrio halodurans]